jgi:hypothetical protein
LLVRIFSVFLPLFGNPACTFLYPARTFLYPMLYSNSSFIYQNEGNEEEQRGRGRERGEARAARVFLFVSFGRVRFYFEGKKIECA